MGMRTTFPPIPVDLGGRFLRGFTLHSALLVLRRLEEFLLAGLDDLRRCFLGEALAAGAGCLGASGIIATGMLGVCKNN